jgi:transposase
VDVEVGVDNPSNGWRSFYVASLLVGAGDNPERLHSEAAWVRMCGVAPIPADSGRTAGHHRLHRGGDRQANSALWRIAMVRIAHDPDIRASFERRVKEGRTKGGVIRILKRYVAREVYRHWAQRVSAET